MRFLGKVKTLSALNLDGNPLEHPPLDIVKQGIKTIQTYLREEHIRQSKFSREKLDSDDEEFDIDRHIDIVADVWASDDGDNHDDQRRITRSPAPPPAPLFSRSPFLVRKAKYFHIFIERIHKTRRVHKYLHL
jgi:hypothetical protein